MVPSRTRLPQRAFFLGLPRRGFAERTALVPATGSLGGFGLGGFGLGGFGRCPGVIETGVGARLGGRGGGVGPGRVGGGGGGGGVGVGGVGRRIGGTGRPAVSGRSAGSRRMYCAGSRGIGGSWPTLGIRSVG